MRKRISSLTNALGASLLSFVILISLLSCADDYKFETNTVNTEPNESSIRTVADAFEIADQAKDMFFNQSETRSGQSRIVDKDNLRVICNSKTRSNTSDTLIYVVNYKDNEGFAIVSAVQGTDELLGITEMGNYDDAVAENPGLSLFMEMAEKYIREITRFSGDPFIETTTTLIGSVSPLISVKWGQEFPEGLYCPNTISGCANTAAIQICSYYQYPTSMNLTFSQRERDHITINWTDVKKHQRGCGSFSSHTNCTASVNSHKVIAEMARQCGVYADSKYYKNENTILPNNNPAPYSYYNYYSWDSAFTSSILNTPNGLDIVDMIESLGFVRPQPQNYSSQCTKDPLNLGRPVFMKGNNQSTNKGHAWVIDGYKYFKDTTTNNATVPATITVSYRYYNHINWGGNGISNGYFSDGVFSTNAGYSYDNPSLGIASDTFNYSLRCFPVVLL